MQFLLIFFFSLAVLKSPKLYMQEENCKLAKTILKIKKNEELEKMHHKYLQLKSVKCLTQMD